jgi:2-iminobutanoate/2-iminopropanoate deaminase
MLEGACVQARPTAGVHPNAGELEDSAFRGRLARDREKREYSCYCDPFGELTLSLAARLMNLISTQTVQSVETADAPPPGGHYSQATIANGFVFVSGQLPIKLGGHNELPTGIDAQTRQVLSNVEAILRAANSSLDRVVSVTVYVTDIKNWPEVNRVYADVFGQHRPARVVAVSPQLYFGSLVEIQAVALAGG